MERGLATSALVMLLALAGCDQTGASRQASAPSRTRPAPSAGLPTTTTGVPGWSDTPYDVRRLGCAKGARAAVHVELPDVVPGDIDFRVSDTGPASRSAVFRAHAAIEPPHQWAIPLVIPDGCPGHTQTITIRVSPSDGGAALSGVETLTFALRSDGVAVAVVRPTLN